MARRKLTEEEKKQFNERRRQTCLERYGSCTYNNMEKNRKTKLDRYGNSGYNNQSKHKQTCLERYDVSHHNQNPEIAEKISNTKLLPETQLKYETTMLNRYGNKNPNLVPEIRSRYHETLFKNYGVTNPLKNKDIWLKHWLSMKSNNSFNTSKAEEDLYIDLISIYGASDIEREYIDDRYPFKCDFYIKSKDLFIEVNYHPTHGPHPFDANNPDDIELLNKLTRENTPWSNKIIEVWTCRDVLKQETAKRNNLNYKMLYIN